MNQKISVVLCFDINYAKQATIATHSIANNSKSAIQFYWVTSEKDCENIEVLRDHLHNTFGFQISLVKASYDHFKDWKTGWHFTHATYLRLLIPYLIDDEKVIYFDSDTLALGDITDFYSMEMGSCPIGGVPDAPGGVAPSKVPRSEQDVYINSGVLLMNLDLLRKDNFLSKCEAIQSLHKNEIAWADQCILNKYAENKKLIINPCWNRLIVINEMGDTDFENLISKGNTNILHFAGSIKPWQEQCSPAISKYWWDRASQVGISDF